MARAPRFHRSRASDALLHWPTAMCALLPHFALTPLRSLCAIALVASAGGHAVGQVIADPYESSIGMLRQATTPQRDGSHLPLLFALRQLRDPDLKSLFLQITQQSGEKGDWPVQV